MSIGAPTDLIHELAEPAEDLLNRHLATARNWYPHEAVPFDEARNFSQDDPWRPEDYPLPDGVRSALFVNLLTEDNLPYYTHTILGDFDRDHPFAVWGRQWTAEEGRHAMVMRDWIHASRAIDPKMLEDGRMVQMSHGEVPEPNNLAELLAYTSFQELATQVAHRNTGRMLEGDKAGRKIMGLVAGDEGRHYDFYSGLAKSAFEVDPSTMMIAVAKRLRGFKMPGTGIPNFEAHAKAISDAGIYTAEQFLHVVVEPTLERWNIDEHTGLTEQAEKARDQIKKNLNLLGRAVLRIQTKSATAANS